MSGALQRLAPLLFPPAGRHTATVIFVHGLGDTGHGWADAVQNWRRRSKLNEVKFILPHAPRFLLLAIWAWKCQVGMTLSRCQVLPTIFVVNKTRRALLISRAYLSGLIQAEIDNGVPSERIVLGGFSQGGAMSLFTGLTTKFKLAGIVGMSSYLPLDTKLPEFLNEANFNQKTPILMCHGNMDQVVPYVVGKGSYDLLKKTGFDVTWKEYDGMGHSACLEEINEVESFLVRQLPLQGEEKKSEL